jgi:hypothetical protein
MGAQQTDQDGTGQRARRNLQRRGLMAGAAALVAGIFANASERIAEAIDHQPLIIGESNTATGTTSLSRTGTTKGAAFSTSNTNGDAIYANATGEPPNANGVYGESSLGYGLLGLSHAPGSGYAGVTGFADSAHGVSGVSSAAAGSGHAGVAGFGNSISGVVGTNNSNAAAAVQGTNTGTGPGVRGDSNSGIGVVGQSTGGFGVFGTSQSNAGVYGSSAQSIGVRGESQQSVGVYGSSANNFAFYGLSTGGVGFYGESTGNIGVYAKTTTGTALYAISTSGPAAQFFGPVFVTGNQTVTGAKSAAVPHPDGSHRRLYCMESPESYFEDFGRGNLVNGRADVRLDRDFAAVVRADDYDVFLTPKGDTNGLYVSSQSPTGFEVRETKGGTSSLAFSYRVVAKRRDIPGPRLEKVDLPPRGTLPTPHRPPAPPQLEPIAPPARPLAPSSRPPEPSGRGPQR